MKMRRKALVGAVMTAAVIVGGTTLGVDRASAATLCAANHFCLFQDAQYNGWFIQEVGNAGDLGWFNDTGSSMQNRLAVNKVLRWDANCLGGSYTFTPGKVDPQFGTWNDQTSSIDNNTANGC